jgi:hypothetical protein
MSATEVVGLTGGDNTAIRPFEVGFAEAELARAHPTRSIW